MSISEVLCAFPLVISRIGKPDDTTAGVVV
jgi:hypothetical protein